MLGFLYLLVLTYEAIIKLIPFTTVANFSVSLYFLMGSHKIYRRGLGFYYMK